MGKTKTKTSDSCSSNNAFRISHQAGPDLSIYGVFDGHGPCGHDVSEFAKNMLVKVLLLDPLLLSQPDSALENAFQQTQRLLEQATEVGHLNAQFSGTFALTTARLYVYFVVNQKLKLICIHVVREVEVVVHFTHILIRFE